MLLVVEIKSHRGTRDMVCKEGPDYTKTDSHSRHYRVHEGVKQCIETQVQGLYGVKTQPSPMMWLRSCRGDQDAHTRASSASSSKPQRVSSLAVGHGSRSPFSCFTPQCPSKDGPQVPSSEMKLANAILQRSQKHAREEQMSYTTMVGEDVAGWPCARAAGWDDPVLSSPVPAVTEPTPEPNQAPQHTPKGLGRGSLLAQGCSQISY